MNPAPASPPEDFASALETWFAKHRKDYPWRQTRDPYAILVSEVMLQQTQIMTVLERGFYARWLARFPDFATLAVASEEDVLRTWEGLGYYRRARNLQKLAQAVVASHGGQMPSDPAAILALPGIGPYTAGAISSFAFDLPEPIVDGNVARVLSRVFNDATPIDSTEGLKRLWQRATTLVKAAGHPGNFNSALMELGQTLCRVGQPDCLRCPVHGFCRATEPASLPVKGKKTTITEVTERVFFLRRDKTILLEQETGNRRTGLWKLPPLPEGLAKLPPVLHKMTYGITRYKVTLWIHAAPMAIADDPAFQFITEEAIASLPMPAPYRKALNIVMKSEAFTLGE
ncbi:MAG: A/G-specific DNA-adenine glycosylase [Verrucomicrobiaceae bacterium]|nr:A/G-specific DNA-adenine glycosylase [Verrucomicrobiaceae bacterium]